MKLSSLNYRPLTDFEQLKSFECGIPSMDRYIHADFENSIQKEHCELYGVYNDSATLLAFFAIRPDELSTDNNGHIYAMEIAYLAVQKSIRNHGIGTRCIREIMAIAASRGFHVLTVEALSITHPKKESYEAVSFYRKCHFRQTALQDPDEDVVPMALIFTNKDI